MLQSTVLALASLDFLGDAEVAGAYDALGLAAVRARLGPPAPADLEELPMQVINVRSARHVCTVEYATLVEEHDKARRSTVLKHAGMCCSGCKAPSWTCCTIPASSTRALSGTTCSRAHCAVSFFTGSMICASSRLLLYACREQKQTMSNRTEWT